MINSLLKVLVSFYKIDIKYKLPFRQDISDPSVDETSA